MTNDYSRDVAAVQGVAAVPTILDVVCRTTGMGFAAIARVTEDRWIACSVLDNADFGLEPGGELKIETTLCHEVRQMKEAIVIDNVSDDKVYCGHPTPRLYRFQSYISVPIVLPDGSFFGTLCALDARPARVGSPEIRGMFTLFAELIAYHLDAHTRIEDSEARLMNEQETSRLREQFIAVLGHDLRNPLASIGSGTRMLSKRPLDDQASDVVRLMQGSVVRMQGLIDNVLDFARGRLGGGLVIERQRKNMEETLHQVLDEMKVSRPDRVFETEFRLEEPVEADHGKIAQLFSNLLANAVTHGADDAPVRIAAISNGSTFELRVTNSGDPIPEAVRSHLFGPFARSRVRASLQGLGLGLYISAEIAKAHGGTLDAVSTQEETRFTLRMPTHRN